MARKTLEERLADVQVKIAALRTEEGDIKKKIQDQRKVEVAKQRDKITAAVFEVAGEMSPEDLKTLLQDALALKAKNTPPIALVGSEKAD